MALSPRLTNAGRPLTSNYLGGESDTIREIPPEFRAALWLTVIEIPLPWDQNPLPLDDSVLASKTEQKVTSEVMRRTTRKPPGVFTLVERYTDKYKQLGTRTRNFKYITDTIATPTITRSVETKNLGNQHFIENIEDDPALFSGIVSIKSVPNVIPATFRAAIPTYEYEQIMAGQPTVPQILGTGEFYRKEEATSVFDMRRSWKTQGAPLLPVILTGQEMTEEFGGGILSNIVTLDVSGLVPDTGLYVVSSVVKPLGNGMDMKETRQKSAAPWPTLISQLWDDEMQVYRTEEEQVVAAGTAPTTGTYFFENIKAIDMWRSKRVRTTRAPNATSSGSAIVTYQYAPFRFPGVIYAANAYYVRRAMAMLVKHTIRTWWMVKSGSPTVGPSGSGADVIVDEIIMDDIIINNLANNGLTYSGPVLHDDQWSGSIFYPATTPSATQYLHGSISGYVLNTYVFLSGAGVGYTAGNNLTFSGGGGGGSVTVNTVGVSGEIAAFSGSASGYPSAGTYGPFAAAGGSGSGASFTVSVVSTPTYSGTPWVGNLKTVAATISPTDIANLWKIQTKSVVMR